MSISTQSSRPSGLWHDYGAEVVFFVVLLVVLGLSTWLSRFIPPDLYDGVLTPIFNTCTFAVAFSGAWLIFRHAGDMRVRRFWGYALLVWGLADLLYLLSWLIAPAKVMNMGAYTLSVHELLMGNLLGWVMVLYPTEALRPGWMNCKIVVWQLLPLLAVVALDMVVPFNLGPVIALYPYLLLALVLQHIRTYVLWCEDNYSTLDEIDVRWLIRYCIMLFFIGVNFVFMCWSHDHTRGFTQQWFVIFMLAYSTEQILFRKDPWRLDKSGADSPEPVAETPEQETESVELKDEKADIYCRKLEQWFDTDKPYLNPDFKLMDMRAVLPLNRTYISKLINNVYGCSFYHFVNQYRVEEAKRLMREQPELKIADVAARSGFSSPNVFSSVFSRATGLSPREWSKQMS